MSELYKLYRPTKFSDVIGQKEAIAALSDMGKRGEMPHTILFTGPSGTGKTTLARILRVKLKCSDTDFFEINAASSRGIDMVRDIARYAGSAPLGGDSRVWLIDECHALTGDAQESFLKLLEDTPSHVYFMLATTNPTKLRKTIITRATVVNCKPLSEDDLTTLVKTVCEKEDATIDSGVVAKIASVSQGSARKALVILHQVIGLKDVQDQLKAIESADAEAEGIEVARALYNKSTTWSTMSKVLQACTEEPETIRRIILGYCRTILLKSGDTRAAMIIEEFRDNFFDSGAAGLAISCFNVVNTR